MRCLAMLAAIALVGLSGQHWHGLWPVANVPGGITPGGQLLLGQGTRMTVEIERRIIGLLLGFAERGGFPDKGHADFMRPFWNMDPSL